jgi:hypothetical protein
VRVALRDHRHVDLAAAQYYIVGHVDIVGPQQSAHDLVGHDAALQVEHVQRAISVFVGPQHEALRAVSPIDPDGRIIAVMAYRLTDAARCHDAVGAQRRGRQHADGEQRSAKQESTDAGRLVHG